MLTNETAEEVFNRLMKENRQWAAYQEGMRCCGHYHSPEINQAREELGKQEPVRTMVTGDGRSTTAMKDVMELCMKIDNSLSYEEVRMLNADQRRVFDSVSDCLNHLKQHEANQCSCDQKPLVNYVAGVAVLESRFSLKRSRCWWLGVAYQ